MTSLESYCSLADPIILDDATIDGATENDLADIELHNDTWIRECRK